MGRADQERELIAAHVDRAQRAQLIALARSEDRSVSAVVRRAIANELRRARERQEATT